MSKYQDFTKEEAVAKLKELAEDVGVCMFCTDLTELPLASRPMALQEVDDQGNLWFISSRQSHKNFEIKEDNRVQLFFSKVNSNHYLSVYGHATIYKDKKTIEEIWTPIAKAWFEEGKDDPDVTILKVAPADIYYWDTQHGRLISLAKWGISALTGKENDDSLEGELKV